LRLFAVPPSVYWTLAVIALSAILWAWLRLRGAAEAGAWLALGLAGQACALQLFEAGWQVRLQMFYGWSELLHSWRGVFLIALAAQGLIVAWGMWRMLRQRRTSLLSAIRVRPWIFWFLISTLACTTIAPEFAQALLRGGVLKRALVHASKVALGMTILAVGTANLVLVAATIPREKLERLVSIWQRWDRRWLPWLAALWVVVISSLLCWFALDAMPHLPDEASHIFQAQYMSTGRLYLPAPPDPTALYREFQIIEGGKWYGAPPAGWAFLFALGYFFGVPWLVNPLLGGAAILLAHVFVRRIYSRDVADAVALLLAASPWLLYLSASFMPHPTTLAAALLGFVGVERARATGSLAGAAAAGLGFGALLHARPLESVLLAGVAGIWWLCAGWKRLRLAALVTTALLGLVMTALFLGYNRLLTGSPTLVPINKYTDATEYPGANRMGFGPDVGNFGWVGLDALPGHGPIDVFMNTNQNLHLLNFELFGWAGGSLLFVILLFGWGKLRQDALMWWTLLVLWAGLSAYWFSGGPDFGPRYWYQMILPCAVLTVSGAAELAKRLQGGASAMPASEAVGRVWAFIVLASVLGMVNVVPWRATDKYHHYRGIRPDVRALMREKNFGRSLVLVRGKRWPDYASASVFNPAQLDREYPGPIFVRDANPEATQRVREHFPDRPIWILAGPTETGDGFRVIEGPTPPTGAMR